MVQYILYIIYYLFYFIFYSILLVDLNTNSSITSDNSCYYSLSESFFEQKYTLIGKQSPVSVSGFLNRGHYLLPFRLKIPSNLPSSFNFQGHAMRGRIIYGLEVEANITGILKKNLKSESIEVGIREISKDLIMPLQMVKEFWMNPFWCTSGNSFELAVALDKNVYSPGDRIFLKFALNTPLKIKYIQISLSRQVRIGPLDRFRKEVKLLGRVDTGRISGCIERRIVFSLPEIEYFTVDSKLIKCQYELSFKVRSDWCYPTVHKHFITVNDSLLPAYESFESYESSQVK